MHTVQALRARADTQTLYLESRSAGLWKSELDLPLDQVQRVQRRFTENDGRWTWLTEQISVPSGGVSTG
ncbi:hypothetical protein [Haloactinospora alba]|uniref:hypothetical protein n=1 Tax=Haloactinospora alba TaxID=405555 RepID=UPI001FE29788|nr:hypothetical protein [Haloactinospora alba]